MKITIEHLTKRFGDVTAVDDLSLAIRDGELVGLLGPSGCGKSTTLYMLSGLTEPTYGRILFGDTDVTDIAPEDREIGLVFQNYALYPHMSVLQNITFPLLNRKIPKQEARARAEHMAKIVHLEGLLSRKPKELSGGQQQRVAIARALVKEPKVLLLDEPLSNLDAKLRVETREEIRRIQQEVGITTIFVTHDQEEAFALSDRIAIIDRGILQQYEEPQEMYLNPVNEFVASFLGMPQINMFEAECTSEGIYVGGVCIRRRFDFPEAADLPQGRYHMGIRPENFLIDNRGCSTVADRVRMTGRDLLVYFSLGGAPMRLLIHSDHRILQGDPVSVSVRPGQIIVFNPDSTTRCKI